MGFLGLANDYTLLVVATGAALLGIVSGAVGTLALLKKQSLLADAVSHASLPGIVIAFILTGTRSHLLFILGAAVAGWFAATQIFLLVQKGKLRQDSSLSLMLSVYFGFGMVLLSRIQHTPGAAQAGIETFLFGQAATMLISDVRTIAIVGGIVCIMLALFWKELFLTAFDPVYAASTGLPVPKLEMLFVVLVVSTVVIGLQTVGVVLMSAMLVAPAAAARQWTNSAGVLMLLAMLFGALSGIIGSMLSSFIPGLPTGPSIIVCISLIAFASFFLAPKRGIVWARMRQKTEQTATGPDVVLNALYMLSLQHPDTSYGHHINVIQSLFPFKANTAEVLGELCAKGLAEQTAADKWSITASGIACAEHKNISTEKQL